MKNQGDQSDGFTLERVSISGIDLPRDMVELNRRGQIPINLGEKVEGDCYAVFSPTSFEINCFARQGRWRSRESLAFNLRIETGYLDLISVYGVESDFNNKTWYLYDKTCPIMGHGGFETTILHSKGTILLCLQYCRFYNAVKTKYIRGLLGNANHLYKQHWADEEPVLMTRKAVGDMLKSTSQFRYTCFASGKNMLSFIRSCALVYMQLHRREDEKKRPRDQQRSYDDNVVDKIFGYSRSGMADSPFTEGITRRLMETMGVDWLTAGFLAMRFAVSELFSQMAWRCELRNDPIAMKLLPLVSSIEVIAYYIHTYCDDRPDDGALGSLYCFLIEQGFYCGNICKKLDAFRREVDAYLGQFSWQEIRGPVFKDDSFGGILFQHNKARKLPGKCEEGRVELRVFDVD